MIHTHTHTHHTHTHARTLTRTRIHTYTQTHKRTHKRAMEVSFRCLYHVTHLCFNILICKTTVKKPNAALFMSEINIGCWFKEGVPTITSFTNLNSVISFTLIMLFILILIRYIPGTYKVELLP